MLALFLSFLRAGHTANNATERQPDDVAHGAGDGVTGELRRFARLPRRRVDVRAKRSVQRGQLLGRRRTAVRRAVRLLGGLDCLVFTGGVGENAKPIRRAVLDGLAWLGLCGTTGARHPYG